MGDQTEINSGAPEVQGGTILGAAAQQDAGKIQADQSKQADEAAPALSGALEKKPEVKEGEQKPDDKKPEEKKPEEKVIPEKYDLKAPDGITLDPVLTEEFSGVAKELGLTNEQAQKLTDIGLKVQSNANAAMMKQWGEVRKAWVAEAKADPEIGGAKHAESLEYAFRAINKFGDQGLKQILDSGYGDNPSLIKFMSRVGRAIGEDQSVGNKGGGGAQGGLSAADVLYGNSNK